MKVVKRFVSGVSATILTLSSLMTFGFSGVAHADGQNCSWTGATNSNFNTAGNWNNCGGGVPQNGDNLVFDASLITSDKVSDGYTWSLNNDISNLTVGSLTFSGTSESYYKYVLTGNGITLDGNITDNSGAEVNLPVTLGTDVTVSSAIGSTSFGFGGFQGPASTLNTNGHTLNFTGAGASCGSQVSDAVNGGGTINVNLPNGGVVFKGASGTFSGAVNITGGVLSVGSAAALASTSGITTSGASTLGFAISGDTTFNVPITLGGTGAANYSYGGLSVDPGQVGCGGAGVDTTYTATLAGPVTLSSDIAYGGSFNAHITGTYTSNGHKFTVIAGAAGTITTPSGSVSAPMQTVNVAAGDNQPSQGVVAGANQTYVIDGQRGNTYVQKGGVLKGNGQLKSLDVQDGGIVAPGHSPGKLTVLEQLNLEAGATYQAELKNKTAGNFDQIVAGNASDDPSSPDVILGDGTYFPTLEVSLYSGASIKSGDTFKIIDNLGKAPVSGTFKSLPEGATFKVGGGTMKISYVGGDGNDIVLTAMTALKAPDTGFATVAAHPTMVMAVSAATALTLFGLARKQKLASAKATRR